MDKSYSIFCIASQLLEGKERDLDEVWETSIKLYDEFLESEFNDYNQSELDCINNFLTTRTK